VNFTDFCRRCFLRLLSAVAAWAVSGTRSRAQAPPVRRNTVRLRRPYIAVQVPAVSFVDEGVDTVLDVLREKAHVNTVWLNTYTWDYGTGGRQLAGYPFPDHGPQAPDQLYGGAVFDYDPNYFRHTALNQFPSPDYQGRNLLQEVLPKAKDRDMDVVAWDFFFPDRSVPPKLTNMDRVVEL